MTIPFFIVQDPPVDPKLPDKVLLLINKWRSTNSPHDGHVHTFVEKYCDVVQKKKMYAFCQKKDKMHHEEID